MSLEQTLPINWLPYHAVMLQVQSSIGHSDYVKRDLALKNLIQPLAGEYGMHNNQPQGTASCKSVHAHLTMLFQ